ncbi:MAG: hypothetical protein J6Q65_01930 [Lentisphaeria bacterium]|nr:hypothetical protein [Lentisphaeria bacterium]
MKQFVHAILSVAAIATLAGCAAGKPQDTLFGTTDPLRDAARKDIEAKIENFKAEKAESVCKFSSALAEQEFLAIPAVAQQNGFKTLAYDMESLDGKTKVKYSFATGRRMKVVVTDAAGKVSYAQILNGNDAYTSTDGIEYAKITLPEHLNELRLRYDMAMAFAKNAKNVSLKTFQMKQNGKVIAEEAVEQDLDGERCLKFDIELSNKDYTATVTAYISADKARNQLATAVKQINGLAQPDIMVKCSRFFVQDGIVFPGFITTDSKDAPQMTIKNLTVNGKIPTLDFVPDMVK